MRIYLLTIFVSVLFVQAVNAQVNGLDVIVPLKSTRSDVERMLGVGKKGIYYGEVDYEKDKKRFTVTYSQKHCDRGWDVPKDTVISIASWPPDSQANKSAEELKLGKDKFFISGDDAFYGTWTDPVAGVQYYFMNMSQQLLRVTHIPLRSDNDKRCDGFPPYVPEAQYYAYGSSPFFNPKEGKDGGMDWLVAGNLVNVAYQATQSKGNYIPYAVVYFDDKLSYRANRKRLAQFRLYAGRITSRMKYESVRIIEGGMNPTNEVEFYVLPKDWKPPAPSPMLPSPQFTRKKQ